MNAQDEELVWIGIKTLLLLAAVAALGWLAVSDYRECMNAKHDKFICRGYAVGR